MEELLSQPLADVIGSRLHTEDQGRPSSLTSSFHVQGECVTGSQQRGVCETKVCAVSEAMSFEVSISIKIYIVIFWVRN
jgi:hypothetical protein